MIFSHFSTKSMNFYAFADGRAASGRVLPRIGAGIAVSIALHGLLLFAYRQAVAPPWRDDAEAPHAALVVMLRAPQVMPEPEAKPKRPVKAKPARKVDKTRSAGARPSAAQKIPAPAAAAPHVIASAESATPAAFTVAPPPGSPQFDPDAARKFARQIATQADPARAGMAVAQIPPKPYATDTRAARVIAQARRPDCKDGIPGGLLAPLVLLLDKKDSGCKW